MADSMDIQLAKIVAQMVLGKELSDESATRVCRALCSVRNLSEEFFNYPKKVLLDIFKDKQESSLLYYPCDVIELRQILQTRTLTNPHGVFFVPLSFARRYYLDYPVCLGVEPVGELKKIGGLSLSEQRKLEVKSIRQIIVRRTSVNQPIYNRIVQIVKETGTKADVSMLTEPQALSVPKIAQVTSNAPSVKLDPREEQIFDFLIKAKQSIPELASVSMRVAGGWVRDKIKGIPSDDIDIALGGMTGGKFVKLIEAWGKPTGSIGKTYLVDQNIEKSKQIEAGGIDIFGQKVEFVNLRTEVYDPKSRVPVMSVTDDPREDAKRRDLTINAMFYNIETRQVEDYVGGMEDLQQKKLRTPMDPVKTFMDDPLRMLRALRFYSKDPSFSIDPSIIEAMQRPEVQAAYKKLSPERASKELRKIFEGQDAPGAIKHLLETGLYKSVFGLPDDWHPINLDQENPNHEFSLMQHTLNVMTNAIRISRENGLPNKEVALMGMSAFFHDFGKMDPKIRKQKVDKATGLPRNEYSYIGHERSSSDFAKNIMTKMGFEPDEKKFVEMVTKLHMLPHAFSGRMSPKAMGSFLAQANEYYKHVMNHARADASGKKTMTPEEEAAIHRERLDHLSSLEAYRNELGDRVYKPLLDGNQIEAIVQQVTPELSKNKALIKTNPDPAVKGVFYIKYLMSQLMDQQWAKRINTPEEAAKFISGQAKQALSLWKRKPPQPPNGKPSGVNPPKVPLATPPPPTGGPPMANTTNDAPTSPDATNKQASGLVEFFNLSKIADASSGMGPDSGGPGGYEGKIQQEDIVRPANVAYSPFNKGDKVRMRHKGLIFEQAQGRVVDIVNNMVLIKWETGKYKGKTSKHNLLNPERLAAMFQKVE